MSFGIDPFSAQNATITSPSISGALPYPSSISLADPLLHTRVTFRFTSLNPTILDCRVVGPNNETCYRVVTGQGGQTQVKTGAGQIVGVVTWSERHPTVESAYVGDKLAVGQWLKLSDDKRVRTMAHAGVDYTWVPVNLCLHLSAPSASEWLARVTKNADIVTLELTPHAIELGLLEVAILATVLFMSGERID